MFLLDGQFDITDPLLIDYRKIIWCVKFPFGLREIYFMMCGIRMYVIYVINLLRTCYSRLTSWSHAFPDIMSHSLLHFWKVIVSGRRLENYHSIHAPQCWPQEPLPILTSIRNLLFFLFAFPLGVWKINDGGYKLDFSTEY